MTKDTALAVLEKMESYERIIITRHLRPDGDAVGSTKGLQAILKASFPEKEVLCINEDYADQTAFLGPEDAQLPEEEYRNALVIVLDSAEKGRVSNKNIGAAKELICFDHHVEEAPYGDISVVEPELSSACELVVNWYRLLEDRLVLTKEAATYLYAGMVTDSGRFRYDCTTPRTFRLAAELLEKGIDTNKLYLQLYASDIEETKRRAGFIQKIRFSEGGVAYLYNTKEEVAALGMSTFDVSRGMVGIMADLKGVDVWANFTEEGDVIYAELRSSLYNINPVAVKYGGGGHAKASGATLHSRKEVYEMLWDLDEIRRTQHV
jgi:phosphoesterase RecJ-like protein